MKKLLFLSALLLALAGRAQAQAAPADIVVVRIREDEWAVVTYGEGRSETVHLIPAKSRDKLTESSEGYHKLISKLRQAGYTLQNSFVNGQFGSITTLVFVKPQL